MSQGEFFAPAANPEMVVLGRELRGFNQSQLAPKLGLSQAHLSRLEAGLTPVGEDILGQLAKALHLPEEFFRAPTRCTVRALPSSFTASGKPHGRPNSAASTLN